MAVQSRLIVISGVGRGLGRAMADGFIAAGHRVFGYSQHSTGINALKRLYPCPHRWAVVDATDEAAVEAWALSVLSEAHAPDLLVNNAALINANAPLWQVPPEEFSRVIDVNIKGVASLIRHFVPSMIERGTGVIVNFSSGWGRSVAAEVAPYCATKWAVEGLTQALALELPAGMAAVPLNPGVIHTEMLASCFGAGAASCPSPQTWARSAVPFMLRLGPEDNGKSLSVA